MNSSQLPLPVAHATRHNARAVSEQVQSFISLINTMRSTGTYTAEYALVALNALNIAERNERYAQELRATVCNALITGSDGFNQDEQTVIRAAVDASIILDGSTTELGLIWTSYHVSGHLVRRVWRYENDPSGDPFTMDYIAVPLSVLAQFPQPLSSAQAHQPSVHTMCQPPTCLMNLPLCPSLA